MEFIKKGSALPIPFNIIPTPYGIFKALKSLFNFFLEEENSEEEDDGLQMKTGVCSFFYLRFKSNSFEQNELNFLFAILVQPLIVFNRFTLDF
jgi:hypothetical protein